MYRRTGLASATALGLLVGVTPALAQRAGAVVALIKTVGKSKEEREAFAALNDTITACLRADVKLNTNRTSIRGALVDALYQRTQPWPLGQAELAGVPN